MSLSERLFRSEVLSRSTTCKTLELQLCFSAFFVILSPAAKRFSGMELGGAAELMLVSIVRLSMLLSSCTWLWWLTLRPYMPTLQVWAGGSLCQTLLELEVQLEGHDECNHRSPRVSSVNHARVDTSKNAVQGTEDQAGGMRGFHKAQNPSTPVACHTTSSSHHVIHAYAHTRKMLNLFSRLPDLHHHAHRKFQFFLLWLSLSPKAV